MKSVNCYCKTCMLNVEVTNLTFHAEGGYDAEMKCGHMRIVRSNGVDICKKM